MTEKLHAILAELAARRQRQRFNGGLAITWWIGIAAGLLLWKTATPVAIFLPILILALAASSIGIFIWSRRGMANPRHIARQIESKHPELQSALLAAMDQSPDPTSGTFSFLQSRLVIDSIASAERDHWIDLVPRPQLTALRALNLTGVFLFFLTGLIMLLPSRSTPSQISVREKAEPSDALIAMAVDPGDVEIERGSPLTIQVRFGGATPESATLETTDESGIHTIPLTRPFTDPIYQTRLSAINAAMTYRVIIPEGASRSYEIKVFETPALRQSEVVLYFPEYLQKPPETLKDPRSIQVVERTRMELSLEANLPELSAKLIAKGREPLELTIDPADPNRHLASEILTKSTRYEIVLTDNAGRRNWRKDTLDIKVIANKAPVVQVVLPRQGEKVTPLQEVRLEARIIDDAGILATGLRYTLDGETWQEVPGSPAPGEKKPVLSHLVDLEATRAKPNDILMWNAWAEDLGPDGKPRRVTGDIHLVQVRNFDEEFYQKSAPPGEGPPAGTALIKLQTQILNSTWAIRRDHLEITTTRPQAAELETLHKSQEIAIGMAAAMEAEISDPAVRKFVTDARLAMKDASVLLAEAHTQVSAEPLDAAIGHEQSALRHLYQLMGSKTMLIQSQGEGEPPPDDSKPKEDLDLKPLDNPYQSEKQAKPELAQEATEAMEILKRLEELAKRQRDLNEEMKALQMAMQQADTAEKRAEIERRLKQLREQQRELLADVDKLQEKASESTPSDQKQALDDAREKAQQAKEQLDLKKLGDALAAGHRAEESLEKLRDDFRETSAAKLAEQLRDLRNDARDLEQRQRKLAESGPRPISSKPTRLSDSNDSESETARQIKDYDMLVEALRKTAETAERAEPLVAKDLGEALRQADQDGIAEALDRLDRTSADVNDPAANQAAQGIAKLTREIENAAERILGNEAQALRYARDELERLADQAAAKSNEEGKPGDLGKSPAQGKPPGEGQAPGEKGQAAGEKPGEGKGQTAGEESGEGQAPGKGEQPGQGEGKGQTAGQGQGAGQGENPGQGEGKGQTAGNKPGQGQGLGRGPGGSAISGPGYEEWRDRMSDLEAVLADPDAQSAVAGARKAAQEMRKDLKRHSREPDPARIQAEILAPLAEAAKELDARLRDIDNEDPLAPVGRDPVPDRYTEIVRQYFEELGK